MASGAHQLVFRDLYSPASLVELRTEARLSISLEILVGLSQRPKRIAPKFFYDETGCRLFDEICRLDEYYLTRTEIGILRKHITEICALFGPQCRLVELGSGSNVKTQILLDHLHA